jgi:choline dehydrogenase
MGYTEGEFDYIVVGGGTAGCVLAARLSEDASVRVLLIEAGPEDRNLWIHLPIGFAKMTNSPYEWGFRTQPIRAGENRVIPLAQGKVLGGGGSINAQVFTRGTPGDYDGWARDFGAIGWTFDEIQPYFIRSEGNERLSGPWHGTDGPLGVSDIHEVNPLTRAWVKAGMEFGLPFTGDFNGETQYGVGYYQTTTRRGRRCSTSVAYLKPVRKRRNLQVEVGHHVNRIVLKGRRATGVEVAAGGTTHHWRARREVILAAGSIGSPTLLQRSGIGDPNDLREAGVEVLHELPGVGKNLQDHCDLDIVYELRRYMSMDRLTRMYRPYSIAVGLQYLLSRSGPLASTLVEGGAFSFGNPDEPTPDLQFHFLPAAGVEAGIAKLPVGYGCTLNSYFLHPRSRGSVRIASADPARPPLIDPNYIADPYDLRMSAEGLRQMREIMAQRSMARLVKRELLVGDRPLRTEEDHVRYVREHGRTSYHPAGTCAMGTGPDAVVSPELDVHGLEGLRVVDCSIMPRIVSSNTQAATVMIAEKGSDLILGRSAPASFVRPSSRQATGPRPVAASGVVGP